MGEGADETIICVRRYVSDLLAAANRDSWAVSIVETLGFSDGLVITEAENRLWKEIADILTEVESILAGGECRIPLVLENCSSDYSQASDDKGVFFEARQSLPSLEIPSVLLITNQAIDGSEVSFRVEARPCYYGRSVLKVTSANKNQGLIAVKQIRPLRLLPDLLNELLETSVFKESIDAIENVASLSNVEEREDKNSQETDEETRPGLFFDISGYSSAAGFPYLPGKPTSSRYRRDFEEISCLGRGGFGCVMKCRLSAVASSNSEDIFAVKVIGLQGDDKACAALLREAATIAALQHRNIVRYYSAWVETDDGLESVGSVTAGHSLTTQAQLCSTTKQETGVTDYLSQNPPYRRLYILMECCNGRTLRDIINSGELWQRSNLIWKLFKQILAALEFMHARKMMHRDLKPCNIFLQPVPQSTGEEPDLLVRVGDFGLTTSFAAAFPTGGASSVAPGDLSAGVGTKFYMAPEQEAGGAYDAKVDIFALGVVFFEMWHEPFSTAMERTMVLEQVRQGRLSTDYKNRVPPQVSELLTQLLQKDPRRRPTAAELIRSPLVPKVKADAFDAVYEALTRPTGLSEAAIIATEIFAGRLRATAAAPHVDSLLATAESSWLWLQWAAAACRAVTQLCRQRGALPALLPVLLPQEPRGAASESAATLLDNRGFPLRFSPSLLAAAASVVSENGGPPVLKRFTVAPIAVPQATTKQLRFQLHGCFITTARLKGLLESHCRGVLEEEVRVVAADFCKSDKHYRAALRLLFFVAPRGLANRAGALARQLRSHGRLQATVWLLTQWVAAERFLLFVAVENFALAAQSITLLTASPTTVTWTHLLMLPALLAWIAPALDPAACFDGASAARAAVAAHGFSKRVLHDALVKELRVERKTILALAEGLCGLCNFQGTLQQWLRTVLSTNERPMSPLLGLLAEVTQRTAVAIAACPSISSRKISMQFCLFLEPDHTIPHAWGLAYTFSSKIDKVTFQEDFEGEQSDPTTVLECSYTTTSPGPSGEVLATGGQLYNCNANAAGQSDSWSYISGVELRLGALATQLSNANKSVEDWMRDCASVPPNLRQGQVLAVFVVPTKQELQPYAVMLRRLLRKAGIRSFDSHSEPPRTRQRPQHHVVHIRECGSDIQYRLSMGEAFRRDAVVDPTFVDASKVVDYLVEWGDDYHKKHLKQV